MGVWSYGQEPAQQGRIDARRDARAAKGSGKRPAGVFVQRTPVQQGTDGIPYPYGTAGVRCAQRGAVGSGFLLARGADATEFDNVFCEAEPHAAGSFPRP